MHPPKLRGEEQGGHSTRAFSQKGQPSTSNPWRAWNQAAHLRTATKAVSTRRLTLGASSAALGGSLPSTSHNSPTRLQSSMHTGWVAQSSMLTGPATKQHAQHAYWVGDASSMLAGPTTKQHAQHAYWVGDASSMLAGSAAQHSTAYLAGPTLACVDFIGTYRTPRPWNAQQTPRVPIPQHGTSRSHLASSAAASSKGNANTDSTASSSRPPASEAPPRVDPGALVGWDMLRRFSCGECAGVRELAESPAGGAGGG